MRRTKEEAENTRTAILVAAEMLFLKKIESEKILPFSLNAIGDFKTFDSHLERLNKRIEDEKKRQAYLDGEEA